MSVDFFAKPARKCWTAAMFAALPAMPLVAEIDLAGEPHAVTADELSESFVNSSETMADLTIEAAEATTFSGTISGNIRLVKTGAAALDITTVNSFGGGTALQAGSINFTVAGSLGSETVTISAGATLNLAAAVECANPIHLMASSSYLKSSKASSAFTGDVTGESGITFTPAHSANKVHATFRGNITIPNGTLRAALKRQETFENFYGTVKVKTVNGVNVDAHVAGLRFYGTGNEWESF